MTSEVDLTVVTPVIRPHNLSRIQRSIKLFESYFKVRWILALDEQFTRPEDIKVSADVIFTEPHGSAGDRQRNQAAQYINGGWVYYLDDDNVVHPKLPFQARKHIDSYPGILCFVFNQVYNDGQLRLDVTKVEKGTVDTACLLIHSSIIKDGVWRPYPGESRCVDASFITDIWNKHSDRFLLTRIPCTYWNFLEKSHHPDTLLL